jgi:CBS domain containing-hemolysin-like protein
MDPINIVIMIAVMLVLLLLAGWFAGSETALTNLSSSRLARLRKEGNRNANYLVKVKKEMDRNLVTILVLNNIVNIVLSSIAALFADALFDAIGVTLMVGLITFLIIVFGEIVPKSNAMLDTERVSLGHARILYFLTRAFTPLVIFLVWTSNVMIRLRGRKPRQKGVLVSDQEIKDLVCLGEEEGVIKSVEREIIHQVFNFGDRKVKDAMVPMKDVFHVDKDLPITEIKEVISSKGYTRVPFMGADGSVKGLLYSKDLLGRSRGSISDHTREVMTIDEDLDLTKAFGEMKKRRIHLAVVTDPKGKHTGIITLEDMIEEIVGDIYDEYFLEKERGGYLKKTRGKNKRSSVS